MADLSETQKSVEQRKAKQAGLAEAVRLGLLPVQVRAMSYEAIARMSGVAIPADARDGSIADWSKYSIRPRLVRLHIADELQARADAPHRRRGLIAEIVRPAMADMELPVELQANGDILIRMADRVEGRGIDGYKVPRTEPETVSESGEVG